MNKLRKRGKGKGRKEREGRGKEGRKEEGRKERGWATTHTIILCISALPFPREVPHRAIRLVEYRTESIG